jgi:transcriptional regulator with XRE-family HTH domain
VATLAGYPGMMQRARKREGLRVCRAAWLIGVSVREYREIEAGDRMPSLRTYERISDLYGWRQTFEGWPTGGRNL